MTRLALINPNTSAETTAAMLEIAREAAAGKAEIAGFTAPFGEPLITTPDALANAAKAVMTLAPDLKGHFDGVIVAAFGDPAVLSLKDALPLVRFRAQAMQDAVPVGAGAMAAILGMDASAVCAGCAEVAAATGEVVEAVNFNGPSQTVIAGTKSGVLQACDVLKAKGAKRAMLLAVSAPFHSSLMKPAAEHLVQRLQAVPMAPPQIAVINNVDVAIETSAEAIRDALYRQAFGAVRWVEVGLAMRARGVTHVIECGPGKVLAGMVKRIDADATPGAVYDLLTLAETRGLLA